MSKKALFLTVIVITLAILTFPSKRPRCEVHGEVLKREEVRIVGGLRWFGYDTNAYPYAKKKLFPHGETEIFEGCDGHPGKMTEEVFYCQQCREAKEKWI